MEWTLKTQEGSPARAATEKLYALGTIRIPARPALPARDGYKATIGDTSWAGIQPRLVEFWDKVCEVWPRYYSLSELTPTWDRVLCTIDMANGFIRAQARLSNETPSVARVALVTVAVPLLTRAMEKLGDPAPDDQGEDPRYDAAYDALMDKVVKALAAAADMEPARSRLAAMRKQHPFTLMVEQEDIADSVRKLPVRG